MADRNPLTTGRRWTFSVPPAVWSVFDVVIAVALTAAATFVIVVGNSFLLGKGSYQQGLAVWLAFIQRPDILGTMILTALVTVPYLARRYRR